MWSLTQIEADDFRFQYARTKQIGTVVTGVMRDQVLFYW